MKIANAIKSTLMLIILGVSHTLVIIGASLILDNFILGNWTNAIIITIGVGISNIIIWPLSKFN